jgi:membrane fusion protein, multidrug efflux system
MSGSPWRSRRVGRQLHAVLVMGALGMACRSQDRSQDRSRDGSQPLVALDQAPVVARSPQPVEAVGVLVPDQVADVASPFAGVLLQVYVRAGEAVAAGEVVAELDPRPLREQLRIGEASRSAAEAARQVAQVDLEDARRRLAVETMAVRAGISPTAELDRAEIAVQRAAALAEQASAAVSMEHARLTSTQTLLGERKLRAPFTGRVAIRYFDLGATLLPGHAVMRIVTERVRLRFAVLPTQAARLEPGSRLLAWIETQSAPVAAVVQQVSPTIDLASGMTFVEAELPSLSDSHPPVRAGLSVRVFLDAGERGSWSYYPKKV